VYLVIEPYAGSVPGMNDPARLAAPSATSSRLGLIECPNRAPFCLAATILSRKPTTEIRLSEHKIKCKPWVGVVSWNLHSSRGSLAQVLEIGCSERELNE
jgi:hypothetical protein